MRVGCAVTFTLLVLLVACTSRTPEPPGLGGCTPAPDGAPCPTSARAGGGGSPPADGGIADALVEDATVAPVEGGTCGFMADTVFAAQFPSCATCYATAAEAGARTCCGEDNTCSMNAACFNIVQCQVPCAMGVCGCASVAPPEAIQEFNNFAQCVTSVCPTVCPPLPQLLAGDL